MTAAARPTRRGRLVPAVVATLTALALTGCGASAAEPQGPAGGSDPDTLVFAAVPAEESTSLQANYQGVIDLLEAETGKTIEFRQATDYAAVIEGQLSGQVQIAQYGPLSYVLAETKGAEITPVAAQVDGPGMKPGYTSYGIVPAGSDITDISGFAGKTVCFVEPNSTSGYLYPSSGLLEAGIDPKTGVKPVFAGGHDASVLEVASKRCDAGFAFDTMVGNLVSKGQLKEGAVTKVWESGVIPGSPIALSNALSPELRQQISDALVARANSDALLAAGLCEGECLVGDEGSWGYAAVTDDDYADVREVCTLTKNASCSDA